MPPSTHAVIPVSSAKPVRRQGGEFRFAITPATTTTTGGLMGDLTLQAGEELIEHYHPFTDEYLYVVEGELTATVEGDRVVLPAGSCLFIQRGAHHSFAGAAAARTRAVVALSPPQTFTRRIWRAWHRTTQPLRRRPSGWFSLPEQGDPVPQGDKLGI